VKIAIVAPKINLETGGGSHYSLLLYSAGLRELGCDVEVHSLAAASSASEHRFAAAGVALRALDDVGPSEQVERLVALEADLVLVDAPMSIAYQLKRRVPRRPVLAHINTLSGFCTNLDAQQADCWLTCNHRRRLQHHPGSAWSRLKYALGGQQRVAGLARGYRSLDGCVFPSPQTLEAYRVYGLDRGRCFVVPECLDVDLIQRHRAAPFGTSGEPLNLLYVGSLAPYKGMRLLFDALRGLDVPWRLRVYGDGDDRALVTAFAAECPGRVDWFGHVTNDRLFPELHGGDFLFVHPCLWFEALGRGILEAMALGIPVLVPDVGGPAWSVSHGVTGLHYRHRDAADLRRWLAWAAAHREDVRRLGDAGRAAARSYDYRSVARQWRDVFETLREREPVHA
jgi:glycosyltransferase involved in cell wall biosynthesis